MPSLRDSRSAALVFDLENALQAAQFSRVLCSILLIYVTGYSTKGKLDTRFDRWTSTHEQEHIKTY